MATLNVGNSARNQPTANATGVNAVVFRVSLSASWSSGDVHLIGKLPHGAIPIDSIFYPGSASPAGFVAKFGTSASQELFLASATYSVVTRGSRRLGYAAQVSLSDDLTVRYENVTMVATAGTSIGHVGDLVLYYVMPGQTP